jgi:myo-inositol-1(or 4)-monophosphatase
MTALDEDHTLLVAAVREAGVLAMTYFGTEVRTWEKEGGTPVSDADIEVNLLLQRRLRQARPDYGWLSE